MKGSSVTWKFTRNPSHPTQFQTCSFGSQVIKVEIPYKYYCNVFLYTYILFRSTPTDHLTIPNMLACNKLLVEYQLVILRTEGERQNLRMSHRLIIRGSFYKGKARRLFRAMRLHQHQHHHHPPAPPTTPVAVFQSEVCHCGWCRCIGNC